jgi:polar amino acid transport system permease protein
MSPGEALHVLWTWTPFLAAGFVWNVIVSLVAMGLGTLVGGSLAFARAGSHPRLAGFATTLTHLTRNVPTFIFLYYLAYLIPFELEIGGRLVAVPAWIKASIALSIAVVGFVSDTLLAAIRDWRRGDHAAGWLFVPSWTMYLVIIVMASSTASVIGVPEIVSRSNTIIAAVGDNRLMIWVYGYAMMWFFLFCWPLSRAIEAVRQRMQRRHAAVSA